LEILKNRCEGWLIILNRTVYLAVACLIFLAAAFLVEGEVRYAFSLDAEAVDSPAEHISVEDLSVFDDKAVIDKEDLIWARVEDTHSMEPVLNKNSISQNLHS